MRAPVTVFETSFIHFCLRVQELIQDGYRFDTDNRFCPTYFPGSISATMIDTRIDPIPVEVTQAVSVDEVEELVKEVSIETKQNKGGRPKKTQ